MMKAASTEKKDQKQAHDDEPEKIQFRCSGCSMVELVNYFGKKPPFTRNIELLEDSFVMKDPFTAPPNKHNQKRSFTEYFIVIGCNCTICQSPVCKDCSVFYSKTFCYECAQSKIHQFPLEVQSKIRKEILAIKK
jgi:hypothetical protein